MGKFRDQSLETGFGLIEIVVSMFLLGLLAIAFLPLLVTSMKATVGNSTIATATQLVDQQMEQARAAGDTCADLTAFGSSTLAVIDDSRGVRYQPSRTVAACPSAPTQYPRTVSVSVSVSKVGYMEPPVSATTLIYLRAP